MNLIQKGDFMFILKAMADPHSRSTNNTMDFDAFQNARSGGATPDAARKAGIKASRGSRAANRDAAANERRKRGR